MSRVQFKTTVTVEIEVSAEIVGNQADLHFLYLAFPSGRKVDIGAVLTAEQFDELQREARQWAAYKGWSTG